MSYSIIISNYPQRSAEMFNFTNLREALNSFIQRCDELGLEYREDNNGNFIAGGIGSDYSIELISTF
jgi:hypothetical protein